MRCPICGNKKLRGVLNEDFCYLANLTVFDFGILEYALKDNGIEVVCVPYYPYKVTYATAGRAEYRKVYVRYKNLNKAKEIYETVLSPSK